MLAMIRNYIGKHWLLMVVLALFSSSTHAQLSVRGELLNEGNGTPIPYANIGILHKNIGTISNADGSFELLLDSTFLGEAITFSALGYAKKDLKVQSLTTQAVNRILLQEQEEVLNEVTIRADVKKIKSRKTALLGNEVHTAGTIRLEADQAGGSVALLISNRHPAVYVEKARLYILQNSTDSFKVRVRLYKKDAETGMPGVDILNESIVITSALQKGWLEVDLNFYNLRITDPEFFLAFEWILDRDDRKRMAEDLHCFLEDQPERLVKQQYSVDGKEITDAKITGYTGGTWFGTTYLKRVVNTNTCYYRLSSLGEWKRSAAILTAGVSVVAEP